MLSFTEFLSSRSGIIIVSILWGLGLATLFKRSCEIGNKGCKIIEYRGPNVEWINKAVFNYGTDDCYRYKPIISRCPNQ